MRRLSRGTPYILTTGEVEEILASMRQDPAMEQAVADITGNSLKDFRAMKPEKRAGLVVAIQERGRLAAALAGVTKARREFLSEAHMIATGDDDPNALSKRITLIEGDLSEITAILREAAKAS